MSAPRTVYVSAANTFATTPLRSGATLDVGLGESVVRNTMAVSVFGSPTAMIVSIPA